jgi:hypothetical protein
VGQCGNQLGTIWKVVCDEGAIRGSGKYKVGSDTHVDRSGKCDPRFLRSA